MSKGPSKTKRSQLEAIVKNIDNNVMPETSDVINIRDENVPRETIVKSENVVTLSQSSSENNSVQKKKRDCGQCEQNENIDPTVPRPVKLAKLNTKSFSVWTLSDVTIQKRTKTATVKQPRLKQSHPLMSVSFTNVDNSLCLQPVKKPTHVRY